MENEYAKRRMFIQNRYEIISRIGSGGMADVYKAKDHKLNRFVAVKVLKKEYREDKSFISKFRVEAQSAAGLAHANIVNIYDVGEEAGIYYIVMELVEGITLKEYIQKKGRLSVRESYQHCPADLRGTGSGPQQRHHPPGCEAQNIIISTDGKVKVADFGIARVSTSDTINSNVMGSVHYSSPEQCGEATATGRAIFIPLVSPCMRCSPDTCPLTGIRRYRWRFSTSRTSSKVQKRRCRRSPIAPIRSY